MKREGKEESETIKLDGQLHIIAARRGRRGVAVTTARRKTLAENARSISRRSRATGRETGRREVRVPGVRASQLNLDAVHRHFARSIWSATRTPSLTGNEAFAATWFRRLRRPRYLIVSVFRADAGRIELQLSI
ncbi:hypothetical protein AAFF_G00232640 [Aldrovandia affinis]|uniref:Uncharacterized protein n=1 Tax=Aldrovandia affinis TaxID=143900 RepID=A0AAD7RF71_9TELE|nr:hypothetical protein AAFF_G00232640 [Aldrovandia affinis]